MSSCVFTDSHFVSVRGHFLKKTFVEEVVWLERRDYKKDTSLVFLKN